MSFDEFLGKKQPSYKELGEKILYKEREKESENKSIKSSMFSLERSIKSIESRISKIEIEFDTFKNSSITNNASHAEFEENFFQLVQSRQTESQRLLYDLFYSQKGEFGKNHQNRYKRLAILVLNVVRE